MDGHIIYILHSGNPDGDDPGTKVRGKTGDKLRFRAPLDGGFTITFKSASPFESGVGAPSSTPITSSDGSPTRYEKLKTIATTVKSFPYTVTLGGITEDPEIIIDNSGGGGKGKKKPHKKP